VFGKLSLPCVAGLAMLVAIAGCGDSGPAPVQLTSDNAEVVASQTVAMTGLMGDMSEMVEGFTEVFETPAAAVLPCSFGNANYSVNDAAPEGEISTGDSASLTFQACVLGEGEGALTLNGTISLVATEVTSSGPGSRTATFAVDFDNVTATAGTATVNVDGGWTMTLSIENDVALTAAVSGDLFRVFVQVGGASWSATLSDFSHVRTYDTSTDAYSWSADWTYSSSSIGGKIKLVTDDTFLGQFPDPPDTGMLTVTGAEGATVQVVALDSENVQLLIDADGDTNAETTITTTWAALGGA